MLNKKGGKGADDAAPASDSTNKYLAELQLAQVCRATHLTKPSRDLATAGLCFRSVVVAFFVMLGWYLPCVSRVVACRSSFGVAAAAVSPLFCCFGGTVGSWRRRW